MTRPFSVSTFYALEYPNMVSSSLLESNFPSYFYCL